MVLDERLIISMSSQLFTKTRQGNSNQKFVRRNSQSPWESNRTSLHTEPDQPIQPPSPSIPSKPSGTKNSPLNFGQRQHRITIRTISSEYYSNTSGISRVRRSEHSITELNKGQESKTETEKTQTLEGIKLDCFPIETMSTCESQPTTRKKNSENLEPGLQTKRHEINSCFRKDIDKIFDENRSLRNMQTEKQSQIQKLCHEVEQLKLHNKKLQSEVSKYRNLICDLEEKLKTSKSTCEDLLKLNSQIESKKSLYEKQLKELLERTIQLEEQVKYERLENRELLKSVELRQKQLQILKKEQARPIVDRTSRQSEQHTFYSPCPKISRSISITGMDPRLHTIRAEPSQFVNNKCNRFIQTEASKYQVILKQNELMLINLKNKDKTLRNLQKDIKVLEAKAKTGENTANKLIQAEKLVETLNSKIMVDTAMKLATKYRYF